MIFEEELNERRKKKRGKLVIRIETSKDVYIIDLSGRKKLLLLVPFFFFSIIIIDWLMSIPKKNELERLRYAMEDKSMENKIMIIKVEELKKKIEKLQNIQESMLTFIQSTNDIKNNGSIGRSNRGDKAHVIRATFSPDEMIGEEELLKKIDDISKGFRVAYEEMMRRERIADYLPTLKPVESGYITSGFGYRIHPILEDTRFHTGVDISAPPRTPVRATAIGKVIEVSQSKTYGKYVKIKHINGIETLYAHLSNIFVMKGEFVEKGEIIGTVGETGLATGPHLHYEILYKGRPIDPLMLMIE